MGAKANKRVKYGKEPVLHVHRYVVVVIGGGKTRYHYAMNMAGVKEIRNRIFLRASVVEVYKASHEFKEAWYARKKLPLYTPSKKKL